VLRETSARSTVYNVKEKYGEIVESQLNQVGRYDGDETTEGDPFEGQLDQQQEWQTIKERPVGVERDKENETEAEERDVITVRLHRQDIERILLDGGVSDEFRRELVNRVLESTFTDAER